MHTLVRVQTKEVAAALLTQLGRYFGGNFEYHYDKQFNDYLFSVEGLTNPKREQAHWFAIGFVIALNNGQLFH